MAGTTGGGIFTISLIPQPDDAYRALQPIRESSSALRMVHTDTLSDSLLAVMRRDAVQAGPPARKSVRDGMRENAVRTI
jgi:hypothetical protein